MQKKLYNLFKVSLQHGDFTIFNRVIMLLSPIDERIIIARDADAECRV